MILFSGLLYDRQLVPLWLKWLEYVSIVNYGFAALILNQVLYVSVFEGSWLVFFLRVGHCS